MSCTFFIGDTHFGHKKIAEFEPAFRTFGSVEEHDETLIDRWNSVVGKRDTVWHLGDVLFTAESFKLLDRLRGFKKLVMGNHDSSYPISRYMPHFSTIVAYTKFDKNWLSHVPIHENELYRCKANIHGHLHSKRVKRQQEIETGVGRLTDYIIDERYVNVSAEHNDLTPISYEDLKKRHPILEGTD